MKISEALFNTLAKVAEANDEFPQARLAAAIVRNNKILSIGINRKKSDPFQARFAKNKEAIFLHAEIHAIKNALRELSVDDLKGTDLYICRVKRPYSGAKNYVWGMAKPCCGCERAIAEFGIKNVIYSNDHGKYETL
ncbi:MAG: deaminase [bacterium]